MIFDLLSDPGHSWLKVPKTILNRDIGPHWRKHFSCFSYEKRGNVYLEEDCDLCKFIELMTAAGKTIKIREKRQSDSCSRIRRYPILSPM